jgi:hypothetical protein
MVAALCDLDVATIMPKWLCLPGACLLMRLLDVSADCVQVGTPRSPLRMLWLRSALQMHRNRAALATVARSQSCEELCTRCEHMCTHPGWQQGSHASRAAGLVVCVPYPVCSLWPLFGSCLGWEELSMASVKVTL